MKLAPVGLTGIGQPKALARLNGAGGGRPGWLLPGSPSAQIDWAGRRAYMNGAAYYDEASIKSLINTFATPASAVITSTGLIKSMPANSLLGFYDSDRGQLIEEERANLFTYSEQFDNAAWVLGTTTISANAVAAPDGTASADRLVEPVGAGALAQIYQNVTVANSTAYSFGVVAKADAVRKWLTLGLNSAIVANGRAWFDLQNGVVGTKQASLTSSGMIALADGWYFCYTTFTSAGAAAGSRPFYVAGTNADNSISYTGDGVSGIYVWGARVETGTFPLSYVPTTSSSVTRTKSTLSRTIEASYNAASGSAYVEFISAGGSGTQRIWQIDTDANNRISLTRNASNQIILDVVVGGASQASVNLGTLANATKGKVAINWTAGACAGSLNGAAVVTGTPASIPTVTTERFGSDAAAANQLNGYYARSGRYRQILSSAQLLSLAA